MEYYDEQTKERYIPHCIEPSLGVDRLLLAVICSAYAEDEIGGEKRNFLKFAPAIAPITYLIPGLKPNADPTATIDNSAGLGVAAKIKTAIAKASTLTQVQRVKLIFMQ